ncbi:MAG: hypothetical protein AMXMBFR34_27270 [Myxococcaceae bacterium]
MTSRLRLGCLAFLLGAACSVPELKDLGEKKCDLDAGHACASGYECAGGVCKVPIGGTCTSGDSRMCGASAGECRQGTQHCAGGTWGPCEGAVGPTAETCDGKDNDCNSQVDDGILNGPACEKSQGVCTGAVKACVGGGFVATCGAAQYGADYEAIETRCDDRDNDCDGQTDEMVSGGACPSVGVCDGFNRACTMGSPGVCQAPNYEADEVSCDTRDNDCDGVTDEVVGPSLCAKQQGVCAGKHPACVGGAFETTCTQISYGADYESSETLCDLQDNDCDDVADRLADGGLIRLGMCELSMGVCAGATRVCVGGNGEAPCTRTSYGNSYEEVEGSCEGLDNDCDGRADVSKEASLVITPSAATNHLGLATSASGGSGAVYVDQRGGVSRVFFRRFNDQLRPQGNEVTVSDPSATEAIRPAIARVGQDFAVTWIEEVGGVKRLKVARLTDSGARAWTNTVASLVNVYNDPRIASATPTSSPILVTWIEAPVLQVKGAVYDGAGNTLTPVTTLTTSPDAGGDLVFDVDAVRRTSTGDFLLGWITQTGFTVRFQAFSTGLAPLGTLREVTDAAETARNVRVAVFPPTQEVLGAWIGTVGNSQSTLRWLPNALATALPEAASVYAGQSSDLALASVAGGCAAFWAQGLPQPRLVGLTLGADAGAVIDYTPAGVTGLFAPGVASLDGGVLQVGYEANRGGTDTDLYGQVICRP